MWNERFANAAGATPSVCRWPTGHAPTFNIYCRWPTGHAPTFNIIYTAGGPPGTPLLIYSSGSQQGFPTHIPPLTIASLPTRGVLCQRHSPHTDKHIHRRNADTCEGVGAMPLQLSRQKAEVVRTLHRHVRTVHRQVRTLCKHHTRTNIIP